MSSLSHLGLDGGFEHIDDQLLEEEAKLMPTPMSSMVSRCL